MVKKKVKSSIIVRNHEAGRDYFILDSFEAGIMLVGCEVKSLRQGKASLAGSFARLEGREIFLYNLYIPPYEMGNRENEETRRERKLLLHRSQIEKIKTHLTRKGHALVPLKLYFKHGLVKVDLAIVEGKKVFDKRADIKKRAAQRDIDRAIKNRNR